MTAPLSPEKRAAIVHDIRFTIPKLGRNAIARKHGVAAGTVTKIARAEGLWFDNDWITQAGSEAHRVDCALARMNREDELLDQYLALPQTCRQRDGKETRAHRRLSYALYNVNRHAQ